MYLLKLSLLDVCGLSMPADVWDSSHFNDFRFLGQQLPRVCLVWVGKITPTRRCQCVWYQNGDGITDYIQIRLFYGWHIFTFFCIYVFIGLHDSYKLHNNH